MQGGNQTQNQPSSRDPHGVHGQHHLQNKHSQSLQQTQQQSQHGGPQMKQQPPQQSSQHRHPNIPPVHFSQSIRGSGGSNVGVPGGGSVMSRQDSQQSQPPPQHQQHSHPHPHQQPGPGQAPGPGPGPPPQPQPLQQGQSMSSQQQGPPQRVQNIAPGGRQDGSGGGGGEGPGNAQSTNLKVEDALLYLDDVKLQFQDDPMVYNQFLDIMKEFKSQAIDTPGVINRVSTLFQGRPKLIRGFNTFLPPGYQIEIGPNGQPLMRQMQGGRPVYMPVGPMIVGGGPMLPASAHQQHPSDVSSPGVSGGSGGGGGSARSRQSGGGDVKPMPITSVGNVTVKSKPVRRSTTNSGQQIIPSMGPSGGSDGGASQQSHGMGGMPPQQQHHQHHSQGGQPSVQQQQGQLKHMMVGGQGGKGPNQTQGGERKISHVGSPGPLSQQKGGMPVGQQQSHPHSQQQQQQQFKNEHGIQGGPSVGHKQEIGLGKPPLPMSRGGGGGPPSQTQPHPQHPQQGGHYGGQSPHYSHQSQPSPQQQQPQQGGGGHPQHNQQQMGGPPGPSHHVGPPSAGPRRPPLQPQQGQQQQRNMYQQQPQPPHHGAGQPQSGGGDRISAGPQPPPQPTLLQQGQQPPIQQQGGGGRPPQGVPGGTGMMPIKPPVEFNHAINYVNKIKTRFAGSPEIYKNFLEILHTYQKEQQTIKEVYAQVAHLFRSNLDLLDEFSQFLPEAAPFADPSRGGNAIASVSERGGGGGGGGGGQGPLPPPLPASSSVHYMGNANGSGDVGERVSGGAMYDSMNERERSSVHRVPGVEVSDRPDEIVEDVNYPAVPRDNRVNAKSGTGTGKGGGGRGGKASNKRKAQRQEVVNEGTTEGNYPGSVNQQPQTGSTWTSSHGGGAPSRGPKENGIRKKGKSHASEGGAVSQAMAVAHPPEKKRKRLLSSDFDIPVGINYESVVFFSKTKAALKNQRAMDNFIRTLKLYEMGVLLRSELITIVEPFLGQFPDLYEWFKSFVSGKIPLVTTSGSNGCVTVVSGVGAGANAGNVVMNVNGEELREKPPLENEYNQNIVNSLSALVDKLPAGPVDFTACKRYGYSYRALPKSHLGRSCSGRTPADQSVLNDIWVSCPTSSEDSYFVNSRKNAHEEQLYLCEDQRFEMDILLGDTLETIRTLEPIAKKIASMTSAEAAKLRLDDKLGGTSATIYPKALKRLYDDKTPEILHALKNNTAAAVPVVLRRLKTKSEEWRAAKVGWDQVWGQINEKNEARSLDHQGPQFKQVDRKAITQKNIIQDLETKKEEESTEDALAQVPHYTHRYQDRDVVCDVARLIRHYMFNCQNSISVADKHRMDTLLSTFVCNFIGVEPIARTVDSTAVNGTNTPDVISTANSPISGNAEGDSNSASTSISKKPGLANKRGKPIPTPTIIEAPDNATGRANGRSHCTSKHDNTIGASAKQEERKTMFYANGHWVAFLRMHYLLYSRCETLKSLGKTLEKEYDGYSKKGKDKDVAVLLKRKPAATIEPMHYHKTFITYVEALLEQSIDSSTYEELCRDLYGHQAHKAFTFDRLIQLAVRQLHTLTTDESSGRLRSLYEYNLLCKETYPKYSQDVYRTNCEHAIHDEPLCSVTVTKGPVPNASTLHIRLLDVEDMQIPVIDASHVDEEWSIYICKYTEDDSVGPAPNLPTPAHTPEPIPTQVQSSTDMNINTDTIMTTTSVAHLTNSGGDDISVGVSDVGVGMNVDVTDPDPEAKAKPISDDSKSLGVGMITSDLVRRHIYHTQERPSSSQQPSRGNKGRGARGANNSSRTSQERVAMVTVNDRESKSSLKPGPVLVGSVEEVPVFLQRTVDSSIRRHIRGTHVPHASGDSVKEHAHVRTHGEFRDNQDRRVAVLVKNALEVKICINSFKLKYVTDTSDYMIKTRNAVSTYKAERNPCTTARTRWRNYAHRWAGNNKTEDFKYTSFAAFVEAHTHTERETPTVTPTDTLTSAPKEIPEDTPKESLKDTQTDTNTDNPAVTPPVVSATDTDTTNADLSFME
eukprot:CFRG4728T1